jgi:cytochrome P450
MSVATRLQAMQPTDVGVPGPTSWDMARAFRSVRADPLTFLGEVTQRFGDTVSFPVPGAPALLLNNPADVRHVLQTSARSWGKDTVQYAALARVTGPGLLASAEPSWIDHRRLAAPAFHHQRLEAVGDEVRAAARTAIGARLAATTRAGEVVDVAALTHTIGLDAVGRALFSTDLSDHAHDLLAATSEAADLVVRLGRSVLPRAEWTPTRTNLRLRAARRRLDAGAAAIIAERRARNSRAGATAHHGDDLLGLLLDSGMHDGEIRDELVTMVIAGHETVAAALAWTLMLLAEHPVTQQRVRDELAAHPGPVPLVGHRDRLPWTRAVVDEALRLYPPAWAISRRSHRDDELDGRPVPAGTLAIISPWLVHRRPDLWPEPEAFRPERFLDGTARTGYLPFGQGPRLCIGREFALGEMVVVLAELLREHRLEVPGGPGAWRRPVAEAKVAVHPRGGMPLVVRRTGTP